MKAYPNPFVDDTQLEYWLPEATNVRLAVYDNEGNEVRTLVDNQLQSKGEHKVAFDSKPLPSGMYTCVIVTPNSKKATKLFRR